MVLLLLPRIVTCTVLTHANCTGPCKADAKAFCKDVSPGDGRLAMCLTKRIKQAQQGNIAGVSPLSQLLSCLEDGTC